MPPVPTSAKVLSIRFFTLWEAALEFGMIHPSGSPVQLMNRRTGDILDCTSSGTRIRWFRAYLDAPMPYVRLPGGREIVLDVLTEDATYVMVEPLPVMGGNIPSVNGAPPDLDRWLIYAFLTRYRRPCRTYGNKLVRKMRSKFICAQPVVCEKHEGGERSETTSEIGAERSGATLARDEVSSKHGGLPSSA